MMLSFTLYVVAWFLFFVGFALGGIQVENGSGYDGLNSLVIAWGFAITFIALGRMHSILKDIRENMGRG